MLTRRHRAPVLRSFDLLVDGVSAVARFDQAVVSEAPTAGWSFEVGTVAAEIADAVIEGDAVIFTVAQPFGTGADYDIFAGQDITASYDSSTGSLTSGGGTELDDLTDQVVGNLSATAMPGVPEVVSATINTAGTGMVIVFDESISGSATLGLTLSGSETITSGSITAATLTLVISQVLTGDVRTFSYNSATGTLAGLAGDVVSITDHAITNNSTVPA